MIQPHTKADLERGEKIVQELHGLKGYEAWAERIAKEIAAERQHCAIIAETYGIGLPGPEPSVSEACRGIAAKIRG